MFTNMLTMGQVVPCIQSQSCMHMATHAKNGMHAYKTIFMYIIYIYMEVRDSPYEASGPGYRFTTVPQRHGRARGGKTARGAKFGNMARTVSCITPVTQEEQIQNPRAMDLWSYATRMAPNSWLGPLLHGDIFFPTWPKMPKRAKPHRNGPHSRCYISMTMSSNNVSKNAIDMVDLGLNVCPIPAPDVASSHFWP